MATRERILDAAAHVLGELGLARATTKEIARAAGYSEATLYKHFQDKQDLFLRVLQERAPPFNTALLQLTERVGQVSVHDTLTDVAATAIEFYVEVFPTAAGIFAEPELLAAHRAGLAQREGVGPQLALDVVANYLVAEQAEGRLRADTDSQAAAALLLGACFQQAFLVHLAPEPTERSAASVRVSAAAIVRTLLTRLLPETEPPLPTR